MTNEERRSAFDGRLRGETWEEIGSRLGYAAPTVLRDLQLCLRQGPRRVRTVYPALGLLIQERYGGNIRAFALDCGINPNTAYSILNGRMDLSPHYLSRMARVLGEDPRRYLSREDRHAAV